MTGAGCTFEHSGNAEMGAQMTRALALAARGLTTASPNPMVGAVVLDTAGRIVGEGWHERPGGPHAEVAALAEAGDAARGGTLLVTLEPCNHHGRTPPCTEAILAAGITRVIYAAADPNPVAAGGAARLLAAGLEVRGGLLADEARAQNAGFFSRIERGRPWVLAKFAASLDGKIATRAGHSQWITSPAARAEAHALRAWADAVVVGVGTVLADDPRLDARPAAVIPAEHGAARAEPAPTQRPAWRVVVDSAGRTPPAARLFAPELSGRVLIATTAAARETTRAAWIAAGADVAVLPARADGRVDLAALLQALADRGVLRVMVEGGPGLLGGFFDAGLIDEVAAFLAPIVIGGEDAPGAVGGRGAARLTDAQRLANPETTILGGDLLVRGVIARAAAARPDASPSTRPPERQELRCSPA